jgi:hypothetical protein
MEEPHSLFTRCGLAEKLIESMSGNAALREQLAASLKSIVGDNEVVFGRCAFLLLSRGAFDSQDQSPVV